MLDQLAQRGERPVRLALCDGTHHSATGKRSDRAQWSPQLVLVIEARALWSRREAVVDMRLRARRTAALPARVPRRVALDQQPPHANVRAAQVQDLLHARAFARRTR